MKNSKLLATVAAAAAAALTIATLAAPAASAATGNTDGSASSRPSTIQVFQNTYNNPTAAYLAGASCLVPLGMADFTAVVTTTACGITSVFSPGTIKLSVPATWPIWGVPVQTETPTPDVLYTNTSTSLSIRFSSPRRFAGFEVTPQAGTVQSFKAVYLDKNGLLIGQINKTISAGKARLIGAKMLVASKVAEIQITSNGDFAIGRLRYKP